MTRTDLDCYTCGNDYLNGEICLKSASIFFYYLYHLVGICAAYHVLTLMLGVIYVFAILDRY